MTFDRDKVTEDAALPVIVEAVLAEIERLHHPVPGSVSALHPIPLCTCLISESCPTARACAAIREAAGVMCARITPTVQTIEASQLGKDEQ